jgi:ABC-2 type transport system ATP-binding protein
MTSAPSTTSETDTALAVQRVSFAYPGRRRREADRTALRELSLSIPAGQRVALLGPNGSGKSTLMKIIGGLLAPDRGAVRVFGRHTQADIRPQIGVIFQSEALDSILTVFENLRDQAVLYGLTRSEAVDRIDDELERARLTDDRNTPIRTLSGGLKRRVDLCRALLHRPRLLLLDEPTVGLDPAARETFLRELERRADDDRLTILMSTHLTDEADRHDRVVLIDEGRIVADDSPAALRHELGERQVTVLDDDWTPPQTDRDDWRRASGGWSRPVGDAPDAIVAPLLASGVSFSIAPPTLADVFEACTGHRLDEDDPSLTAPVDSDAEEVS